MLDDAKKRRLANPQGVLRNLAGLKSDTAVGFLPVILSNPKAEHALYDLRAIALHGLVIDAVLAHVNAALPRAFEWVFHLQGHAADAVDQHFNCLAVLNGTEALVVGAAADQVT